MTKIEISTNELSKRIYTLRSVQIMLDSDLAKIYEVETKVLKQAVKRNIGRFPNDFMFKLTKNECEFLRSQIVTSNFKQPHKGRGGSRHLPSVFTELGVAMLSSVLGSERAIEINIEIMRAFVQLRKQSKAIQLDLIPRIKLLENKLTALKRKFDQLEIRKPPRTMSAFAEPEQVRVIQNAIARRWGLNTEDLKSTARSRGVALTRDIAIYLVRKQLHMSFSDIGRCFGRRDHTTILYAYRKISSELDVNRLIQNAVNAVQGEIAP